MIGCEDISIWEGVAMVMSFSIGLAIFVAVCFWASDRWM